jgi:DNA-directed RNA polymerase specialized sigma24 family protein
MQDDQDHKAEKQTPSRETRPDAGDSQPASPGEHDPLAAFDRHRGLLFSIAYRMLGSRADAEDMLQETFLRWQQASETEIRDPRAFLVTVITRLCINQLQSARVKREQYFGQWLPEPVMESFKQRRGRVPSMIGVMAQSPAILQAYLSFNHAFEEARMPAKLRGLITTTLAQFLGCEYVLSIAAALGTPAGISSEEFEAARKGTSDDPKITQALRFAKRMVEVHGQVDPSEITSLQQAGYSDEEIVEIIGLVALNLFRIYFNLAVRTEVNFPAVRLTEALPKAAAR